MSDIEAVARLVQRLAVLTEAGIPAASAWRHAAGGTDASSVVDGLESPQDLPDRIAAAARAAPASSRSAWQVLAAVWAVSTEAGAALAPSLTRTAEVLRDLAQSQREVETALAGPVATSRIVLALPAFGALLGLLLGFDILAVFTTVPGLGCLVGGGLLIALGMRWNGRLIRWARTEDAGAGVGLELTAVAVSGGASVARASRMVAAACSRAGLRPPGDEVHEVLQFSASAGVPVTVLLRAEADECRRRARAEAASRAAQLESRMLVPLGCCILPAFVLVGVAPTALAILAATALSA
jgi:tight adherence protein B